MYVVMNSVIIDHSSKMTFSPAYICNMMPYMHTHIGRMRRSSHKNGFVHLCPINGKTGDSHASLTENGGQISTPMHETYMDALACTWTK